MSDKPNDGGPAFPGFQYTEGHGPMRRGVNDNWEHHDPGMSLRDFLAAQVAPSLIPERLFDPGMLLNGVTREHQLAKIARDSYAIADALIAARSASPPVAP